MTTAFADPGVLGSARRDAGRDPGATGVECWIRSKSGGYERQRRPIALEYVNTITITIANKRNLETADPREQREWRETMTRAAADPALAREYLLRVSMIASLRKAAALA